MSALSFAFRRISIAVAATCVVLAGMVAIPTAADAVTPVVVETIPIDGAVYGIASDGGHVYVAGAHSNTLSVLDESHLADYNSSDLPPTIPVGPDAYAVAAGDGNVYVANFSDGTVSVLDESHLADYDSENPPPTIPVGFRPLGVAVGGGNVYVTNAGDSTVSVIDESHLADYNSENPPPTIPVGTFPYGVAVGGGNVYVTDASQNTVSVIDESHLADYNSENPPPTIPVGQGPYGIAVGGGNVYVPNYFDNTVSVIDESHLADYNSENPPPTVPVGRSPYAVAVGGGNVYVANDGDNTVSAIDESHLADYDSSNLPPTVPVGAVPTGVTVDGGRVYVANQNGGTVSVLDPDPLTLSPDSLPHATVGSTYRQTFVASDGTAPYTYAVSAGTLPSGWTLNASSGKLTGTVTTAGKYHFTVTATDSGLIPKSRSVELTLLARNLGGNAYETTVLGDGPVAYWPMDESSGSVMTDLSGNGNTGAYEGDGVSLGATGVLPAFPDVKAASFDGTSDAVVPVRTDPAAGTEADVTNLQGGFSVEAWISPAQTAPSGTTLAIIGSRFGGGDESFDWKLTDDNLLHGDLGNGDFWWNTNADATNPAGDWTPNTDYYLTITDDGSVALIYINGTLAAKTYAGPSLLSDVNHIIHIAQDDPDEYFNGSIGRVAIYDNVLTADQIASHWTAGTTTPAPPAVDSVSPSSGPAGTQVTVTGSGFQPGDTVVVGQGHGALNGAVAATDLSVDSPTQITATVGDGAVTGTWNLFVISPDNTASAGVSGDLFTYTPASPPAVNSVSPNSGPDSGGAPITITGTGFTPGDTVVIGQGHGAFTGALAATDVVVVDSAHITATTGGGAAIGQWNLFVIDSGNNASAGVSGDLFTYTPAGPPAVSDMSVHTGPATGGTSVTITGTGFAPGDTVVIGQGQGAFTGALPATNVDVVSSTTITATTPGPATTGNWNLFVIDSGNHASNGVSGDLFAYNLAITSITPNTGPVDGGSTVTITGAGFKPGDTVVIGQGQGAFTGAITATDISVDSPTQITVKTGGAAQPGTFNLFVIDPGNHTSAGVNGDLFTYTS